MNFSIGKILIAAFVLSLISGLAFLFQDKLPFLRLIGHLPGDFTFKYQRMSIYIPITTSLLFSGLLSLIFIIIQKIFK